MFLFTTRIVQDTFRVDLKSEYNRLKEVNRRDAYIVGAKRRLKLKLVDLCRIGRVGAEQTTHKHAGLVQILKQKARHRFVAKYGTLCLQHVNICRVVKQNLNLFFRYVIAHRTPDIHSRTIVEFLAYFRFTKIVAFFTRCWYDTLHKAGLE